jgi:hypothetical protein
VRGSSGGITRREGEIREAMRELRESYLRFSREEGFEGLASSLRHYSAIGVSEEGFVRFRREVLGLATVHGWNGENLREREREAVNAPV